MKTLIVYYSRTETTAKVCRTLAERIGADLEEVVDQKDRQGMAGYLVSGRDAMKGALTDISESQFDPSNYELIVLATPVWAWTMTPAIRTYIEKHKGRIKKLACLVTQGASKEQGVSKKMADLVGLAPVASEWFSTKEVHAGVFESKLDNFISLLK